MLPVEVLNNGGPVSSLLAAQFCHVLSHLFENVNNDQLAEFLHSVTCVIQQCNVVVVNKQFISLRLCILSCCHLWGLDCLVQIP